MADIPGRLQEGTNVGDAYAIINRAFDAIDGENRTKIIYNGSTPTLLMGYQSGGFGGLDYGLKIAKPGKDVTVAANSDLAFSSAFDSLKVVQTGTTTIPTASGTNWVFSSVTVNHNLGFVPLVIAYGQFPSGNYPIPWANLEGYSFDATHLFFAPQSYVTMHVGANQLTFDSGAGGDGSTSATVPAYTVKYYLLQETAI